MLVSMQCSLFPDEVEIQECDNTYSNAFKKYFLKNREIQIAKKFNK